MKKMFTTFLALLICITSIINIRPVKAEDKLEEYLLPIVSDIVDVVQLNGLSNKDMLKSGIVLIPIEKACEIADAKVIKDSETNIMISRNTITWCCNYDDLKYQYLFSDIRTGSGDFYNAIFDNFCNPKTKNMLKVTKFFSGFNFRPYYNDDTLEYMKFNFKVPVDYFEKTELPYKVVNGKLYVSFYHFLTMMGVNITNINSYTKTKIIENINWINKLANNSASSTSIEELNKELRNKFGFDTFFCCNLGVPIDKIYQDYYINGYLYDISRYFSKDDANRANIANSISSFDGVLKTVQSGLNLDTKYEDSLLAVITQKGKHDLNDQAFDYSKAADEIQYGANGFGFFNTCLECLSQEQIDISNTNKLFNNKAFIDSCKNTKIVDANAGLFISIGSSLFVGYINASSTIDKINTLFEDDKKVLKKSVLISQTLSNNATDEVLENVKWFAAHFYNPELAVKVYFAKNVNKLQDSYTNFKESAKKVQDYIDMPEFMGIATTVTEGMYALGDEAILSAIDFAAFGGVPVTNLVCSGMQLTASVLKNTPYFKNANKIATIDDCYFIQCIAENCFKEQWMNFDEMYYSFTLGVKSSMTAYIQQEELYEYQVFDREISDLEKMLSDATNANREYFTIFPSSIDLSDMIQEINESNNTDINVKEITTTPQSVNDTDTNEEELFYDYIKTELVPKYGLPNLKLNPINYSSHPDYDNINGIISAYILSQNSKNRLITVRIEKNNRNYRNYFIIEMYDYQNNNVSLIDKYQYEIHEYAINCNIGWSQECICIEYNYNFNYEQPKDGYRCCILEIEDSGFNELFNLYYTPVDNKTTWIRNLHESKEYPNGKTYYETEKDYSGNELSKALEEIKHDLNDISFNNYSLVCEADPKTFVFKIEFDNNILFYNFYESIIKDYTDLRSHITSDPKYNNTSNVSGRYSNDNIFVDVIGEIGDNGNIRIEYKNDYKQISCVKWQGIIEPELKIIMNDGYSDNLYQIKIGEEEIDFSVTIQEVTNQIDFQTIVSDRTVILPKTLDTPPSYDISSWDNERIIRAINKFLFEDYNNEFSAYLSDINEQSVLLHKNRESDLDPNKKFSISWDKSGENDDFAELILLSADASTLKFHLTDYDTNDSKYLLLSPEAVARNEEDDTINLEIEPETHYYGTETVNGILLTYDLYLSVNKNNIFVSAPTETGGSIGYTLNNITYSDGVYYYSDSVQSELVPGAMRSLIGASYLTGYVKVIDNNTIEWNNQANGNVGRSFTLILTK